MMCWTICCLRTGGEREPEVSRISLLRLSDRGDLSVPRGSPQMGARYDADACGRFAEGMARFLGTGRFIVGQTVLVIGWIILNTIGAIKHWDPYPFILLNLAFSTQAAYAAPLILLAQTRQVDRDKVASDQLEAHREEVTKRMQEREAALKVETDELKALLQSNTQLTQQAKELTEKIEALTREIHTRLTAAAT